LYGTTSKAQLKPASTRANNIGKYQFISTGQLSTPWTTAIACQNNPKQKFYIPLMMTLLLIVRPLRKLSLATIRKKEIQ